MVPLSSTKLAQKYGIRHNLTQKPGMRSNSESTNAVLFLFPNDSADDRCFPARSKMKNVYEKVVDHLKITINEKQDYR